jgi:hypothetical protein
MLRRLRASLFWLRLKNQPCIKDAPQALLVVHHDENDALLDERLDPFMAGDIKDTGIPGWLSSSQIAFFYYFS